jgi:putative sterol carrier protein
VPLFPTDGWFQEYIVRINGSQEYRAAAADWEGDIAFLIEAEPDKNVPHDVYAYLDLWHGGCRHAGVITREEAEAARYQIAAPYTRWKDVLLGDLDPIKGMMQGKLKVRGDLPMLVRQVRSANELVRLTGEVDTVFPDET